MMENGSGRRRFFRLPVSEGTLGREIDDEIAFHIDARAAALVEQGFSAEDARQQAEREFGDIAGARSELAAIDRTTLRRERRSAWWDALWQDARLAVRGMVRNPAFTVTVVLTLALGIGVNAAMFGITDRLLLSAPPHIAAADEIVRVLYEHTPSGGAWTRTNVFPYADYSVLREVAAFEATGAFFIRNAVLGRSATSAEIRMGQTTATLFPLLGVQPALGRFFSPAEDALPRGEDVVVLSHALWRSRFGGDAGVLGSLIDIDNRRFEVIGVAPRGFNGVDLQPVHAWVPVSAMGAGMGGDEWHVWRGAHYLQVVARLGDGVAAGSARQQASVRFVADNGERFAGDTTAKIVLGSLIAARGPATGAGTPQRSGRIAIWLLGVSLMVVLIACVNVANLLLARGMRQRREIGVRIALGIGRSRLAVQTLTETMLIASLAAALGLMLAHWTGQLAHVVLLPDVEWGASTVSRRVVMFTAAITVVCAVIASVVPALHAARSSVTGLLGPGGRSTRHGTAVRSGLVALQATLSVLLLVGAGLFLRSLREAGSIPLGYEPDRVAAFSWHTAGVDWSRERTLALYDAALERVQPLPQVEAATLTMTQPMWGWMYGYIRVPGLDSIPTTRDIIYSPVTPDYFRTVGARLLEGRAFTPRDVPGSPDVAIVTESLARVLWPGESALGKCFASAPGPDAPCREIVGVTEDVRYGSVLDEPSLMFYLAMAQDPGRGSMRGLLVRLRGDTDAGIASLHAALQSLEPDLPHLQAELLEERVAPELLPWRLGAVMFSAFGALALLLASLGLYGVVAYEVAQRRRELGVRVALGARVANVLRLVLGDALRVVAIGLVIGLAAAVYAAPWIEPLLYGIPARDPAVHAGVAVLLLAVALLAAALPAWRAAHVQPTEALRDD